MIMTKKETFDLLLYLLSRGSKGRKPLGGVRGVPAFLPHPTADAVQKNDNVSSDIKFAFYILNLGKEHYNRFSTFLFKRFTFA